ncbi:amidohydrolase family protein [Ketobacter sp. MCCC 1A13808]|nr:amidohydrolase family protein [Ketobacter sp. MCCC 1A13808]
MTIFHRLALLLVTTSFMSVSSVYAEKYKYNDAHLHYVNFSQQSQGIEPLIEAMDSASIEHSVISGLPVIKKWADDQPGKPDTAFSDDANVYWYSLTDEIIARAVLSLPESQQRRLHPFICGFNPTDKNAAEHVARMLEWYPGFWQGIGEVITRHDDLTALTYGETARANHPALMRVYKLAAKHDLPVLLHSNITSMSADDPVYLSELEDALKQNPNTRFIWAHAGTSKTINLRNKPEFLAKELERLLSAYANLWIDLSWTVMDDHIQPRGKVSPRWLSLIENHADRFMLGSDVTGSFKRVNEKMQDFIPLLEQLQPEDARRVAKENFLTILPKTNSAKVHHK